MADKQILAKYVHDAVEMEVSRHTLLSIVKLINKRADSDCSAAYRNEKDKLEPYCRKIKEIEKKRSSYSDRNYDNIQSHKREISILNSEISDLVKREKEPHGDIGSAFRKAAILGPIILLLSVIILNMADINMRAYYPFAISAISCIAIIIIDYYISKSQYKRSVRKAIQQKQKKIEVCEEVIKHTEKEAREEAKEFYDQIEHEKKYIANIRAETQKIQDDIKLKAKQLCEHINIEQMIASLDKQIHEFYSLNLIPPDYRSLECVIAFDQMFRNDLVDNMREAALLYDERVFRGEMIKGLDNIYNAINELSGLMSETVAVLRSIESNTVRMCDELKDISSNLVRMNANVTGHLSTISSNLEIGLGAIADSQNSIASELEYSRYANDAIRASSDRMIWYTEQRRQGLL